VTVWVAWLLVPFAAALWSRLVGVEAVFEPLRSRLAGGNRFGRWLLSGFQCVTCSAVQAGLLLGAWVAVPGPVGIVGRALTVGMTAALLAVLVRNAFDVALNRAQYRATIAKQATELGGEGPRYRIVQTRTTVEGTEIAVAPMTSADELLAPRNITTVSIVPTAAPLGNGWTAYHAALDTDGFDT
jgi:hypothetical protein